MAKIDDVRDCRAAKALIDIALWDLRGKILGQPVWRLLGGSTPKPVPLTWISTGSRTSTKWGTLAGSV
jgi:L-alanine-DL-glutamate epimerase-like enolase superfamily enzyme